MGKEGKILFQFILVLFPVCLVILQLGKDRAVGPVFVPTFMLSTLCCFTLAALLKRSVCCHFPLLFTMCTTTGLNWDQIPLYWALFEHLQTAIQDWKNLKSLPTWMQSYLLPTNCEFQMMVIWFANTSPLSPKVGRSPFLPPNQPCQYYSVQLLGHDLLQSQVQESPRRSGLSESYLCQETVEDYLWTWTSDELDVSQQIHWTFWLDHCPVACKKLVIILSLTQPQEFGVEVIRHVSRGLGDILAVCQGTCRQSRKAEMHTLTQHCCYRRDETPIAADVTQSSICISLIKKK